MNGLTPTLQRTYDAIHAFEQRCGHGPTARELARALDIGYAAANGHVLRLRDLGLIEWTAGRVDASRAGRGR